VVKVGRPGFDSLAESDKTL